MRINTKLMLVYIFLLTAISCHDSDVIENQSNVSEITPDASSQVNPTSDEDTYRAQSDFENMLVDQIIYRDSVYILNMSKEEAIDLTIPDSLYVHYMNLQPVSNQYFIFSKSEIWSLSLMEHSKG